MTQTVTLSDKSVMLLKRQTEIMRIRIKM